MSDQVYAFTITVALGLLAGVFYDFFRVMRRMLRPPRWLLFCLDLAFWLVMTVVVFIVLLASVSGEVRAYVLVGMGLGGCFYVLLFSRAVFRLTYFLVRKTATIISALLGPPVRLARVLCAGSLRLYQLARGAGNKGRAVCQKISAFKSIKRRN